MQANFDDPPIVGSELQPADGAAHQPTQQNQGSRLAQPSWVLDWTRKDILQKKKRREDGLTLVFAPNSHPSQVPQSYPSIRELLPSIPQNEYLSSNQCDQRLCNLFSFVNQIKEGKLNSSLRNQKLKLKI